MKSFHWDQCFITGLHDVDQQHHHLVDLINDFGLLLARNQLVLEDFQRLFKQLADYTVYHFTDEESLMLSVGIDERHLKHHKASHQDFIEEISKLSLSVNEDNTDSARHLLDFLTHWLAYHILGEDQFMAQQINAIRSGLSAEQAYNQSKREQDRSTEPLLVALNGLFELVSTRNRELVELNQSLEDKVIQRTVELSKANQHLEELSLTDVLTGLPNRRHAMRRLESLWDESVATDSDLVCIMIDADHFKEVNDTYGHDAGDLVLTELAKALQHAFRTDDIVCRLGGDEFFVICPDTDLAGGIHIAELTRKTVADMRVATGGKPWHGSISIGVAARTTDLDSFDALIKQADEGVYAAKQAGKNCVKSLQ